MTRLFLMICVGCLVAATAAEAQVPIFSPPPAPLCLGDGTGGPRVEVVYARASDRLDRYAQVHDDLVEALAEADGIFNDSARRSGGSRRIRFLHGADCLPVIRNVVLGPPDDDGYAAMVGALLTRGFYDADRKYLVFLDAPAGGVCGHGTTEDDDQPGVDNLNDDGRSFAVTYNNCWVRGAAGQISAHELMHTLGAVQQTAPHGTSGEHCTDGLDLMCRDDGTGKPVDETACPDEASRHLFDCKHDDYFSARATGWLASHWNTANSRFLYDGAGCDASRIRMARLDAEAQRLREGGIPVPGRSPSIIAFERTTTLHLMRTAGCKPLSILPAGFATWRP